MKNCQTKTDYYLLSPVEVYQLVLAGKIKRFPKGFWTHPEAKGNAVKILQYLFESVLQWSPEDIKKNYSQKLYARYKLKGLFTHVFNDSPYQAINAVYPNQFKEWELKIAPNKFWNKETGIRATKWLIEEKLKWSENDIKEKICMKVFISNRLSGMLQTVYHESVWQAINAAYPNQFKEWELHNTPTNFWNMETAIRASKWLIEEKLKWTDQEIKENLRLQTFYDHGLRTMIKKVYNYNIYKALNAAYPGRFQESDFKGRFKKILKP
jgi:hypothetical protein